MTDFNTRDFTTGTIAELCQPVSALEISAEAVSRNAAYTSTDRSPKQTAGRMKQMQTSQGPRNGGGWKNFNRKPPGGRP